MPIGDLKATEFLRTVTRKLNNVNPLLTTGDRGNDTLKQFLMRALPATHRAVLSTSPHIPVQDLAEIADRITEAIGHNSCPPYAPIQSIQTPTQDHPAAIVHQTPPIDDIATLTARIAVLEARPNSSKGAERRQPRPPPTATRTHDTQCYFHRRFGTLAKKCQPGCTFPCVRDQLTVTDTCIWHSQFGTTATRCAPGCHLNNEKN